MRTREATKLEPHAKRIVGILGVPSRCYCGEGRVDIDELDKTMSELPGVSEDGMSGKNAQRKPGTTRGSPRRSRTAKTPRINRHAAKSRCAREWGGWGRVSDDGPGHYNPDPSEGPWGGGLIILSRRYIIGSITSAIPSFFRRQKNQPMVGASMRRVSYDES